MNQTEITQALHWRYATKRFDPIKKISEADWQVLQQSLIMAPSSYGLQPWKFLVVQNPQVRQQLRAQSWNQSQVTDCSHYVVLTTRATLSVDDIDQYLRRIAEVRDVPLESLEGFKKGMVGDLVHGPRSQAISAWSQRQAYIAMGFLLETAALLRVDACPMEGLDPKAYDRILGLEGSAFQTVAAVALGYRHSEDPLQTFKKVRFADEHVVEFRY